MWAINRSQNTNIPALFVAFVAGTARGLRVWRDWRGWNSRDENCVFRLWHWFGASGFYGGWLWSWIITILWRSWNTFFCVAACCYIILLITFQGLKWGAGLGQKSTGWPSMVMMQTSVWNDTLHCPNHHRWGKFRSQRIIASNHSSANDRRGPKYATYIIPRSDVRPEFYKPI